MIAGLISSTRNNSRFVVVLDQIESSVKSRDLEMLTPKFREQA